MKQYNLHMGGVGQVDQQLHNVRILRKTYKWYRKLAPRLISQAVLNAHKVFVKTRGLKDVTFLKFMHDTIVLTLQLSLKLNKKSIQPDDTLRRLTGRPFPGIKKPDKVGSKDPRLTKICRVCYSRGVRTDKGKPLKTVHICQTCPSQPGLHIDNCFHVYHTVINYAVQNT